MALLQFLMLLKIVWSIQDPHKACQVEVRLHVQSGRAVWLCTELPNYSVQETISVHLCASKIAKHGALVQIQMLHVRHQTMRFDCTATAQAKHMSLHDGRFIVWHGKPGTDMVLLHQSLLGFDMRRLHLPF